MTRKGKNNRRNTKSGSRRERRLTRNVRLSKKSENSSSSKNVRPTSIETPITNSSVSAKTLSLIVMG
jgi:hypothetical protein